MSETEQPAPRSESSPRRSPLHALHEEAGASFTDFGGWLMPVRYTSDLAEHKAVRDAAGIFDVSHMGDINVRGADAAAFLDYALANEPSSLQLGQARYGLLLTEDGGILDDLIVYRTAENGYSVIANAGNRDIVATALAERASGFEAEVRDVSDDNALIAVQGPKAREILERVEGLRITDGRQSLADVKYYRSTTAQWNNGTVRIGRTGYTGEDGFELWVQTSDAAELWRAIVAAGEPLGLVRAGLAARDSLRLEAGMPLYGHELGTEIHPMQAGLGRVVKLSKPGDFVGRSAIEGADDSAARVLVGLVSEGRRAGRAGYAVVDGDSEVGTVTSGALSPTLGHPIAMAFVEPGVAASGTELAIDVRGTRIPATVTPLPFYSRKK